MQIVYDAQTRTKPVLHRSPQRAYCRLWSYKHSPALGLIRDLLFPRINKHTFDKAVHGSLCQTPLFHFPASDSLATTNMSSFTITNEDLYTQGRRFHQLLQSYRGDSPETQFAWDKWIDFNRKHPLVAREISSQSDIVADDPLRPWNEAEENQMYVDKTHWNSFLRGCAIGAGFRIEIESIVTFMRSQYVHMWRNKSQYGKSPWSTIVP
jgi:hypothetical protein